MKIAILSDIHSNVFALEAVLKDLENKSIDIKINLGDILYGPIEPFKTYELLKKNDFITICGNQDRQIFQANKEEIDSNPTMQFILEDLNNEALEWMKQLPFDKYLDKDIYLCHGTPNNDLVYLLEDIESCALVLKKDKDIVKLLDNNKAKIILCGHSHTARVINLSNNTLLINPGSVGLQAYMDDEPIIHSVENHTSDASYAILEINEKNEYKAELYRVSYDYEKAAEKAALRNREDWVHFLRKGTKLHNIIN